MQHPLQQRALSPYLQPYRYHHNREIPSQNELAKKLDIKLDKQGYIKVDAQMRTSLDGVYAAGDITGGLRQVITSASEGAIAALSSTEALGKQYPY